MERSLHYSRGKSSRGKSNLVCSIGNSLQKKGKKVWVEDLKKEASLDIFSVFQKNKTNSVRKHLYLHPVITRKYIEVHIWENIILSRSWKLTVKMVSDPISTLISSALMKGNELDLPRIQHFRRQAFFILSYKYVQN